MQEIHLIINYLSSYFAIMYGIYRLYSSHYAGLAIATTDNRHSLPDYPEKTTEGYDEEYGDERAGVDFNRFLIIFVLTSSLCL